MTKKEVLKDLELRIHNFEDGRYGGAASYLQDPISSIMKALVILLQESIDKENE